MPPRPFIRKGAPPHATLASSCFWSGNGTGHEISWVDWVGSLFKADCPEFLAISCRLELDAPLSSAAVLAMFWGGTGAGANCVIWLYMTISLVYLLTLLHKRACEAMLAMSLWDQPDISGCEVLHSSICANQAWNSAGFINSFFQSWLKGDSDG